MSLLTIRTAHADDWQIISSIEATCFPPAEAASSASIRERLSVYPSGCLVAEINDQIIGFVNGGSTNRPHVQDAFYTSMEQHRPTGLYLVIFGLDVLPDYQGYGYGRKLMAAYIAFAISQEKTAILLTCKSHLCSFYESFGYKNLGLADSNHGGAQWYEMRLDLS